MSTACADPRGSANLQGATRCTQKGKNSPVIDTIRRLWPRNAVAELVDRTGASERMCKYWLARRYDMSADRLTSLLRSDAGLSVLDALMGTNPPAWWRLFKADAELANLNQRIEAVKAELLALREIR